jgi:hypothetical protein
MKSIDKHRYAGELYISFILIVMLVQTVMSQTPSFLKQTRGSTFIVQEVTSSANAYRASVQSSRAGAHSSEKNTTVNEVKIDCTEVHQWNQCSSIRLMPRPNSKIVFLQIEISSKSLPKQIHSVKHAESDARN